MPGAGAPPIPDRPTLVERREYVSASRQDRFIVALLKTAIEDGLRRHSVRGGRALDVGCGGQPFRRFIESLGMAYIGLDAIPQKGLEPDFVCAIDATLPDALIDGEGFDLVLCTEVMEHVADWQSAWDNLSRLLKPGGKLVFTCPFFYPLHEEPYDFYRATPYAIRHWADRSGLEIVELRKLGDAWDVLGTSIAASGPKPANLWPHTWLIATTSQKLRKLACWVIFKGWLRRWIRVKDAAYLSNYAVLRRPEAVE